MNLRNPIASLVFTKVLLLGCAVAPAQESDPIQDLTDGIVEDVIDRTIETARHEVIRNTGNDPLKWGYILSKRYEPVSDGASDETRRELQPLNEEHNRKITKLGEDLQFKVNKAQEKFDREVAKEGTVDNIEEKRAKLIQKVYDSQDKFEEKMAEKSERFDEKRIHILSKS